MLSRPALCLLRRLLLLMCWRMSGLAAFVHLTIACFVQSLLPVMCAVTLQSIEKFELGLLAQ